MRGNLCGVIEVLSRHTCREDGKSWRKPSLDNRGVPEEVQIAYVQNICLGRYRCADLFCACDSETFFILWGVFIALYLSYNGCTYGRVSVFTCCRWSGEYYMKLDH